MAHSMDAYGSVNKIFSLSFTGSRTQDVNVFNSDWKNNTSNIYVSSGFGTLRFQYTGSSQICVYKIVITIDGKQWKYMIFSGGSMFWTRYGCIAVGKGWGATAHNDITIPLDGYKQYNEGNPYFESITTGNNLSFTTVGFKSIIATIYYKLTGDILSNDEGALTESHIIGTVTASNPSISAISVSGATSSFYVNNTFNSNGLSVKGIFTYRVGGAEAYTSDVTSLAYVNAPSLTTAGSKSVTVSYAGKSATYPITVYGIKSFTKPNIKSAYKLEEPLESLSSTITYDDNTTETVSCNVTASTTTSGSKSASYKINATKTGEQKTWTSNYTVYDLEFITINTDSCTKNFDYNGTFSSEGIVITEHFGANDEAGTISTPFLTGGYDVVPQDWTVGKDKVVQVIYGGKNATYLININGLYEVDFDITNCALFYNGGFRIPKNGLFTTANKTCSVRRYTNGSLGNFETYSGVVSQSTVQTNEVGTKSVTFSITENGITLSKEYDVEVYSYDSLEIKNAPKNLFISGGVNPVLSLGNMEVIAKTSDGLSKTLSYSNGEFSLSPAVGTELTRDTLVTISTDYGVSATFEVKVLNNAPAENATITVSGSLVKRYYSIGETISLEGITVKVSQMLGGETNYEVDNFNAVISGKDNLVFEEGDSTGNHDLVISVEGVTNSVTITDGVALDTISSITNISCSRVYKSGEAFDISTVSGTVNYLSGETRDVIVNDITAVSEVLEYGDTSVSLTICGLSVSCSVTVIKINTLTVEDNTLTSKNYNYGEKFDKSRHVFKVTYSDGTTIKEVNPEVITASNADLIPSSNTDSTISFNVSYTEAGYTVTSTLTLNIKVIKYIKLLDSNLNVIASCIANGSTYDYVNGKFALDYGNTFNIDNYIIAVKYTDNDTYQIVIDSETLLQHSNGNVNRSIIKNKIENVYISGTVGKQTVKCYFTIHCHYLSALETVFTSITGTHYVYDTLDLSGITAQRVISSTDTEDSNYPIRTDVTSDLSFAYNGTEIGLNNFKLPQAGSFSLVATYEYAGQKATSSQLVSVESVVLSSITLTTNGAFKPLANYIEGQNLILEGLSVNIVYNKTASNRTILYSDPSVEIIDTDGNQFSKTKLIALTDDDKNLYVKYTESGVTKTAQLGTLNVQAKVLSSISVVQNPTVTSYTYGDIFSVNGTVLKATFNNGDESYIDLSDEDLTISGVTIGHEFNPTDDTTFGQIAITFSYEYDGVTKTTSVNISLVAPQIDYLTTNINNSLNPVQIQFRDQADFNMSGLVVTAVMKNGWSIALASFSNNAATVLNLDGQNKIQVTGSYGYKTITLTGTNPYNNTDIKTTTYQIEVVSSGTIVSAFIKLEDDYNSYLVGDTFNAKGVSFVVTDIDGNTWNAKNIVTEPAIGTMFRSAQKITVKASYTNSQFVKTESFDIIVSVDGSVDFTETNNYKIALGRSNGTLFESITHEETTIQLGKVYNGDTLVGEFYPVFRSELVEPDDNPLHTNTYGLNVYKGNDPVTDCVGYVDLGIDEVRNAHLILFEDPINPIEGQSNIEVTFPHYVEGNADKINNSQFGIVYNNRLFVSGNENFKNIDWHTSETNEDKNEFTYFSDLDYCKYGSDFAAIVGYDIFRDGDLLVIKEGSRNEATLYRRETSLITATDYSGQTAGDGTLVEEAYPCYPINSNGGEGGISPRTVVNFVGETLVLTRKGLKAITANDNIANNEKYSVDVSSFINAKITYEEIENAHLYTYKEMLFLKTNRGVYVGYNGLRNDDNEYEWYFLDNIDADIFFELEGCLYFGNSNGEIYRFYEEKENPKDNEYVDKQRIFVGTGGTTLNVDSTTNKVILNGNYSNLVEEGDSFHLITNYLVGTALQETLVYASLGNFINDNTRQSSLSNPTFDSTSYVGIINSNTNTLEIRPSLSNGNIDEDELLVESKKFYEGREVYLDQISGAGTQVTANTTYFLKKYEDNPLDLRYKLVDEFGVEADLTGVTTVRMSFIVNDLEITKIKNITPYLTTGIQFDLLGDHDELLNIIVYNNISEQSFRGVITKEKKISSYYITAPFTFGTITMSKTIWQWVIANDTNLASYMDIGYLSSRKQGDYELTIKSASGSKQLNFGNYTFDKIQFTSDKLPHIYTKYRVLPNVGFVRFLFRNNEASNMVLTTLQLVYTISQFTKGER